MAKGEERGKIKRLQSCLIKMNSAHIQSRQNPTNQRRAEVSHIMTLRHWFGFDQSVFSV